MSYRAMQNSYQASRLITQLSWPSDHDWLSTSTSILDLVDRTWQLVRPVLASSSESSEGVDHEEARAAVYEPGHEQDEDTDGAASSDPGHKLILNMAWRAIKEAG